MANLVRLFVITLLIGGLGLAVGAQRVAVLAPAATELDKAVAARFSGSLTDKLRVLDADMVWAAYSAVKPTDPFNMSSEEAQRVGAAIGCDYFVLLHSDRRRRASLDGPDRTELFSAMYVVNSKTGLLASWNMISYPGVKDVPDRLLFMVPSQAQNAFNVIKGGEGSLPAAGNVTPLPDPDSPESKTFRPPVPYRRIKPEYSRTAYLYDVTATVEATVDLDEKGRITNLAVTRWAGYELDESVEKAIRSMNWRPAERNGKPLPVRFLLRYNFKKIEKDDSE
jgi:hypothetical protein